MSANTAPAPAPAAATVLTPRGRRALRLARTLGLALCALVIGIVITLSSGAQASAGSAAGAPAGAGFDTVVVEEGDSLWSIAQSVSGGQDTRDVVLDIVEVNGLDRQVVHPGQELAVPGR
ncbi:MULTISPECIES: LysM peptidoglycan-binding domain-containing protein [unclassified Brevibacterium]|uniref:LysM peptidoglycan-binding domain-containing protein n=1 Tax=unclassified Brevibacterium TaxID=2614124 RepID=UPI0010C79FAA|nr:MULTISPECIES: LysM peptidoglycan-binding domain-containing protein [unclassified Brevibacterium]MCK1801944.1 LysM peptidoglycan-binding domain-containing protein [Brevibacterium sp. R8603A2]QCP06144.1 LysM peptidoglycan-binding domain-containing protein [Brevibacterium sp. CS2]